MPTSQTTGQTWKYRFNQPSSAWTGTNYNDATANWTMGDLNRQSFMDAWNSAPFVKLREAHLRKDVTGTVCERCVAYQPAGDAMAD